MVSRVYLSRLFSGYSHLNIDYFVEWGGPTDRNGYQAPRLISYRRSEGHRWKEKKYIRMSGFNLEIDNLINEDK